MKPFSLFSRHCKANLYSPGAGIGMKQEKGKRKALPATWSSHTATTSCGTKKRSSSYMHDTGPLLPFHFFPPLGVHGKKIESSAAAREHKSRDFQIRLDTL